MDFDKEKQVIILDTMPEYAVALSSLMHGLRVARINPDVRESLGEQVLAESRQMRDAMLHQPMPALPFKLPLAVARTVVAGVRCARYRSTNTPESALSRVRRQSIGNLLLENYRRAAGSK